MKTKSNHIEIIAAHVVATLPDSLSQRLRLLESLLEILPANTDARSHVAEMIHLLSAHEKKQLCLFPTRRF